MARTALVACEAARVRTWVAFSIDEGSDVPALRGGEALTDAVTALPPSVSAVLLNCSAPAAVVAALPSIVSLHPTVGAYPNGFLIPTASWLASNDADAATLSPEQFASYGAALVAAGAHIVGGCCGIGPSHIGAFVQTL